MNWFTKNWRKLLVGGCGAVGVGALVFPVLVPAAAVCAVVVPVTLGGGSLLQIALAAKTGIDAEQKKKLADRAK